MTLKEITFKSNYFVSTFTINILTKNFILKEVTRNMESLILHYNRMENFSVTSDQ